MQSLAMSNAPIHTFFRPDGSSFRVRAVVVAGPMPTGLGEDIVLVTIQAASARKFKGGEKWGMGRFADIKIDIQA